MTLIEILLALRGKTRGERVIFLDGISVDPALWKAIHGSYNSSGEFVDALHNVLEVTCVT